MYSYFYYGASASEVEVDTLTGDFTILYSDLVMDVGSISCDMTVTRAFKRAYLRFSGDTLIVIKRILTVSLTCVDIWYTCVCVNVAYTS